MVEINTNKSELFLLKHTDYQNGQMGGRKHWEYFWKIKRNTP